MSKAKEHVAAVAKRLTLRQRAALLALGPDKQFVRDEHGQATYMAAEKKIAQDTYARLLFVGVDIVNGVFRTHAKQTKLGQAVAAYLRSQEGE